MFIQGENEIYFIDRDNSVFEVEGLKFLHRKNLDHHLKDTLLDGVIFKQFNTYDNFVCNISKSLT